MLQLQRCFPRHLLCFFVVLHTLMIFVQDVRRTHKQKHLKHESPLENNKIEITLTQDLTKYNFPCQPNPTLRDDLYKSLLIKQHFFITFVEVFSEIQYVDQSSHLRHSSSVVQVPRRRTNHHASGQITMNHP